MSTAEESDDRAQLKSHYRACSTEELLRIANDPGYTELARHVVRALLCARGVALDEIDRWRPPELRARAQRCSDRSAAYWMRLAEMGQRMDRATRRFSRPLVVLALTIQLAVAFLAMAAIVATLGLFVLIVVTQSPSSWINPEYSFGYAVGQFMGGYLVLTLVSFPPIALSWLQVSWLARRWKAPARILLLRPFDRSEVSKGLASVIRDHAFKFGHTYTLSDRVIKTPWYTSSGILVGRMTGLVFRHPIIVRERGVETLCRRSRNDFGRNVNWLYSRSKIFPVACDEDLWWYCVQRLLGEVDVVLIDLTGLHRGVVQEVEECLVLQRMDLVIFLANTAWHARVRTWLSEQSHRAPPIADAPLVCYDAATDPNREALDAAILDTLAGRRGRGARR